LSAHLIFNFVFNLLSVENDDEDEGSSGSAMMMMDEGSSSINQPIFSASPNEAADGDLLLRTSHNQFQVILNSSTY